MAHTTKNNMTGRAAATQRAEVRQQILEIGERVDLSSLRERLKKKETDAIARCVALEDRKSFYAWYVSVDGSISKRVELIEERIMKLETEARGFAVASLPGIQPVQLSIGLEG